MCKPLKGSIRPSEWCNDGSHDLPVCLSTFLSEPEVGGMFGCVCTCLARALEINNAIVACVVISGSRCASGSGS